MKNLFTLIIATTFFTCAFSQQTFYDVTMGNGNGIRFWQADAYKIHMGNGTEYNYGPVTDYSIKLNMNNDPARGWTWGTPGVTPIAALNTQGNFQIAGDFNVGNSADLTGRWIRTGLGTYATYPLNLGSNYKSGIASAWDTDGVFFGLSDQGSNRKDAIIAWGDDSDDMLRFLFNNSELLRVSPAGNMSIGSSSFLGQTRFRSYEAGSSTTTWRGRVVSSGDNASVVMGEYNSRASIGAHNPALNAWSDLYIQHGGGNVAIGTQNLGPQTKLHVYEAGSSTNNWRGRIASSGDIAAVVIGEVNGKASVGAHNAALTAWSDLSLNWGGGNVGIGTQNPQTKLEVNGDIALPSSTGNKQIYTWSGTDTNWRIGMSASPGFTRSLVTSHTEYITYFNSPGQGFAVGVNGGQSSFEVHGADHTAFFRGNVGIGTTSPNQKLTVNGTIYGKEVKVDLNVPGPDYVFEKDYKLPSLDEIKSYVDQHKHLPEVPSAKEMEQNGINVSEMNMILLKKVEELTLFIIDQKAELTNNKAELEGQALIIKNLQHRLEQLEKK